MIELLAVVLLGASPVDVGAGLPSSRTWELQDGPRRLQVRTTGRVDGQGLLEVELDYGSVVAPARVGAHVMVRTTGPVDWAAHGVMHVRALMPSVGLHLVADVRGHALDAAVRLRSAPGVVGVFPDFHLRHRLATVNVPPNDPRYGGQWYLKRIAIEQAWALSTGSPDVTVVVVDNGCETTHPDLVGHMDTGRDVVDQDDDPSPEAGTLGNNHGTACAGLVAAQTDNAVGMAGACPECRLRCVRLLSDSGLTPVSADVEAFQFALSVNAAVVSNSWGFVDAIPVPSMLATAIENVFDNGRGGLGAMVLFAAGNDDRRVGTDELQAVRGVVCVGAINNFDEATSYTNFGEPLDVVAPTGTVATDLSGAAGSDPGDYTTTFGGTSSACPVAAGVAGLLVSAAPTMTAQQLSEALITTSRAAPYAVPDGRGHDDTYGYGVMDPAHALRSVLGLPEPVDGGTGASSSSSSGGSGGDAPPPGCGGCSGSTAAPWALAVLAWAWRRTRSRQPRV